MPGITGRRMSQVPLGTPNLNQDEVVVRRGATNVRYGTDSLGESIVDRMFADATPSILAPGDEAVVERDGSRIRGPLNAAALRWFDVSDVAVGDNTADDTLALQELHTAAGENGLVYYPPGFEYRITDTLQIPNGQSILMYSPVIYHPTVHGYDRPAMIHGVVNTTNSMVGKALRLWVRMFQRPVAGSPRAWDNENAGCIILRNLRRCSQIEIAQAQNGYFGVKCEGNGDTAGAFAYNDLTIAQLNNCRVPLWMYTTGDFGWCNQNTFYLNQVRNDSNTGNGLSRYGIKMSGDGSNTGMNSNLVLGASFELNPPGGEESIPFDISRAGDNEFRRIRVEQSAPIFLARHGDNTRNNLIELIHRADNESIAVKSESTQFGIVVVDRGAATKIEWTKEYDTGDMGARWFDLDGSGSCGVVDWVILRGNADWTQEQRLGDDNTTGGSDYFGWLSPMSTAAAIRALTTRIDFLEGEKVLRIDAEWVVPGRIAFQCFNGAGSLLDDTASPVPLAVAYRNGPQTMAWNGAVLGGVFRETANSGRYPWYVNFSDDVAYVHLLFWAADAKLHRVAIYARPDAKIRIGPPGQDRRAFWQSMDGQRIATANPSVGTWERGTVLRNPEPSAAGKIGRVCLSSGTASTISTTGDITTGTAILEVASASGLEIGQYISIAGVTGTKRIIGITGTTVTIDSNADDTVSGAAVANVAPTWGTYGAID